MGNGRNGIRAVTPIPKSLLISLLAICLLAPSLTEAHRANPWVAGLITPVWWGISYFTMTSLSDPGSRRVEAMFLTIPGLGHFYADPFGGGARRSFLIWASGWMVLFLSGGGFVEGILPWEGIYWGIGLVLAGGLYDALHAPITARRHNEKHAKEKESRITVYPAFAFGKEYVGIGVGVGF